MNLDSAVKRASFDSDNGAFDKFVIASLHRLIPS